MENSSGTKPNKAHYNARFLQWYITNYSKNVRIKDLLHKVQQFYAFYMLILFDFSSLFMQIQYLFPVT